MSVMETLMTRFRSLFIRPPWLSFALPTALLLTLQTGCATTQGVFEQAMSGESTFVDLSHPLNPEIPIERVGAPFTIASISTIESDGLNLSQFSLAENSGTNIEAPARLVTGTASVDKLPLGLLVGYGVVVDVTKAAASDPGYKVTRSDLESWESDYGAIPPESILLLRTGWSERWSNPQRYLNADAEGRATYPGISTEAVDFLVRERRIHALGIDTPSLYAGSGNEPGQRTFLTSGKFHINNLAGLDQLPPKGSLIIATPLSIQGGAGAPARVIAIIPQKKTAVEPGKKKVDQDTGGGLSKPGGAGGGSQGPGY